MFRTTRKLAIVLTSAAALVALASPAAFAADTGDNLVPTGAVTIVNSGNVTFSGTLSGLPFTATCTSASLTITIPSTGLTAPVTTGPKFSGCTDNGGGTDTITPSGSWSLTLNDNPTEVDPVTEPNTGDQLTINIPANGATFTTTSQFIPAGCVVTVGASTPRTSTFNDGSGSGTSATSGTFTNASINVSGNSHCTASSPAKFSGTFTSSTHVHDTT
jgi:hypothetical protein